MNMSSVGHFRGDFVMKFRKQHKMTQEQFAEFLGVTKAAVVLWEQNRRGLSDPLYRLLQLFNRKPELMREF